jgi:soluble lytic murein transglycosylase-like protein
VVSAAPPAAPAAVAPAPSPAPALAPAPVAAVLPLVLPVSRDPLVMAPGTMLEPAVAAALPSHELPAVRVVARSPRLLAELAAASARLAAAERKAAREAKARADSIARVAPLEHVLRRYSTNRTLTRRIAAAIARESRRSRVEPSLVVAVLIAENNILKPHARNRHTNASGLMQVMPGWAGRLGCPSTELTDVDVNICHGVRVLALHLREARGDLHRGLQKFNGCRPTPGSTRCDVYPSRVLAHAERLEGQMETYAERQKKKR